MISGEHTGTLRSWNVKTGELVGQQGFIHTGRGEISFSKGATAKIMTEEKADVKARKKSSRKAKKDLRQMRKSAVKQTSKATVKAIREKQKAARKTAPPPTLRERSVIHQTKKFISRVKERRDARRAARGK